FRSCRYARPKAPDPYPHRGLLTNSSSPPEIRLPRPLVTLLTPDELPRWIFKVLWNANTKTDAVASPRIAAAAVPRPPHRTAERTARPASSAPKLDWEKVRTSPPHSIASTTAAAIPSRARRSH